MSQRHSHKLGRFPILSAAFMVVVSLTAIPSIAQPEIPKYAPPLTGHVTDGRTGDDAADVLVVIYKRDNKLTETRTDDNGNFTVAALPADAVRPYVIVARYAQKNSGAAPVIKITGREARESPGGNPVQVTTPEANTPVEIKLPAARPLLVKVTDTAGKPIAGAQVVIPKVQHTERFQSVEEAKAAGPAAGRFAPSAGAVVRWEYQGIPIVGKVLTGKDGSVLVNELPRDTLYVEAHKEGYADTVKLVRMSAESTVTLKLAREAIVEGTVLIKENEPLAVPQWRMKMQGWREPWGEWDYFRMGYFDAKGHYKIRNVTSLDVLGDATHSINIDIGNEKNPTPEISGTYVPPSPGAGWDLMVTVTRNGKSERYISFVKALDKGIVHKEGDRVRHDLMLTPMALIKGKFPAQALPGIVHYLDPRSIYGPWLVQPARDGSFEVPIPIGNVTLNIGNRAVKITGLKAQEVRTLTEEEILAAPENKQNLQIGR